MIRDVSQRVPVKLELVVPSHIRGVHAEPVVLDAAQDSGQLTIEYAMECGVFNMPLSVRATSQGAARPAVAETQLEIIAPR